MKDIVLSVIIPVCNTEKYFKKCIDSVILALGNIDIKSEIIVINDGSSGNIEKIIKDYLVKYSDLIVFISQTNKGRGATRNLGILKSSGKYIHFVDSDDYVDEKIYLDMFSKLNEEQSDIVVCDFENIDYKNSKNNCITEAKNKNISDVKWGIFDELVLPSCCNKIIRKELFDGITFPENINYEDLATIPAIMLKAKKVSYVSKALYKYVQNEDSVMHEKYDINRLNIINALEIVCKEIEKLNISTNDCKKAEYMIYTRRYYEELLEKIMLSDCKADLVKEFCKRIKGLDNKFWENEYYIKLISSQGKKRKMCNRLLHNALQRNNIKLLNIYLTKRLYYRYFAIRYTSNILA